VDAEALRARADASGRGALIQGTSPQLSGAQRRRLRALGNPLQALVHVGQHGWSEALAWAVEEALMNHELVKVRVLETSPETIPATALWIHEVLEAEVVQWLGRTLLVWRPHPTRPRIHPGAA
jgi:RNA-binding protein